MSVPASPVQMYSPTYPAWPPPKSTSTSSLAADGVGLKALVGTVKSGHGDAFVDGFLSRVGEARNDTAALGGHVVRYFNTPGGEGYAYAEGTTVTIGYIPPSRGDLGATQEPR